MLRYWHIMTTASFIPTRGLEQAVLDCDLTRRSRSSFAALAARPTNGDPLPDPFAELDEFGSDVALEQAGDDGTEDEEPEVLPTPTDVPAPQPTDVPVPEPWDVPPPDPADPRPKSIP